MSVQLKPNVDGITGELYLDSTIALSFTASQVNSRVNFAVGAVGAEKLTVNASTGAAVFSGAVSGITTLALAEAITLTATGTTPSATAITLYGLGGNLHMNAPTGQQINQRINNTTITQVTSTGLAVTGNVTNTGTNKIDSFTSIALPISTSTALNIIGSSSGLSSLRIAHGTAPSAPVNGDIWTTTSGLFIQINGVTKTVTLV